MNPLPLSIHTAAQTRELDRVAIKELGIPSYTLMTRAGAAALSALRSGWPVAQRILVVCGPGNNGGDGYVLARLARQQQLQIVTVALEDPQQLRGDAGRAYADFAAEGGRVEPWSDALVRQAQVIVDAVFGTGLSRPVEPAIAGVIRAINGSGVPVLAVDVPSGLNADTGEVLGEAVIATRTIAFIGLKLGFYLGAGPDHTGSVIFDGLQLPAGVYGQVAAAATRIDEAMLARLLPPRHRTSHKGQNGSVLIVAGGPGMAGAARLAGEAALRVGAGRVTVATHPDNAAGIVTGRPELICRGISQPEQLAGLIASSTVIALGPGLGQQDWARGMFRVAIDSDRPMVIDADGLNLLAESPRKSARWILTPHPGEAGRLLGVTAARIQRERLNSAQELVQRYGGTVVLKGAGTLVVTEGALPALCDRGNPGMATPGMGDVLTGVVTGLLAQTADPVGSAAAGVLVHALAGDLAARRGERGLLASDLFEYLPTCVNPVQRS